MKSREFFKNFVSGLVRDGYCIDLNQESMVKRPRGDDCARGPMVTEHTAVDFVDCVPKIDVGHVDRHLEHAAPVAAGGLQDCEHVIQCQLRLLFDCSGFVCTRGGIDRQLARSEEHTSEL